MPPENEIHWPRRVRTLAEAVKYIDATGYCTLFPVNNVPLPSLYYAVTRRNIQNIQEEFVWDKLTEMVWRWKDELPHRRRAFYAKYFRGRGTSHLARTASVFSRHARKRGVSC